MHLVLDLDETLVSVTHDPYHHVFIDESFNVGGQSFFLKKRPHLTEFLSFAFRNFKSVSVFTAGTRDYATEILRIIMTPEQRQKLMVFFSREHLQPLKNGSYTKALASICKTEAGQAYNASMKDILIVDDRLDVHSANIGNALIIPAYKGEPMDNELQKLKVVLRGLLKIQGKVNLSKHKKAIILQQITL